MRKELYKRRFSFLLAFMMIFQMTVQPFSGSFVYAEEMAENNSEDFSGSVAADSEPESKTDKAEMMPDTVSVGETSGQTALEPVGIETEENPGEGLPFSAGEYEETSGAASYNVIFYQYDNTSVLKGYYDIPKGTKFGEVGDGGIKLPSSEHSNPNEKFKYWYSDPNKEYDYNAESEVTDNLSFFQLWVKIWTVTFDSMGGDAVEPITEIEDGSKIDSPSVSRDKYEFGGWYTDPELANKFNFGSTTITENKTLYAKWTPKYTVEFHPNNGSFQDPALRIQDIVSGNTVQEPEVTRDGHTFKGWYSDSGLTKAFDPSTPINKKYDLYAKWEIQKRTVSFDSTVSDCIYPEQIVDYNSFISEPSPEPKKNGYKFNGWKNGQIFWNFSSTRLKENVTLVADFKKITYDVIYEKNFVGQVNNMPSNNTKVDLDSTIVDQGKIPTTDNYDFTGWYTEESCEHEWDFSKSVSESDAKNDKITLYAGWKIKKFTVSFNTHTDEITVSSQKVEIGKTAEEPVGVERQDFLFQGWFEDPAYKYPFNFKTGIKKDYVLHAKWVDSKLITFETDGGTAIGPLKHISGNRLLREEIPETVKTGYSFDDWYVSSDLINKYDFDDKDLVVSQNFTLYAKWNINDYTAKFYNEGKLLTSQTVSYGSLLTDPKLSLEKSGYTFSGWYEEGASVSWDFSTKKMPAKEVLLHAGWKIKTYTVSFDGVSSDAIISPKSREVDYNSLVAEPDSAVLTGYRLDGWHTGKPFTNSNRWDFSKDRVVEDITLIANWQVRQFTVKFDTDGGSSVKNQTVVYNGKVIKPAEPKKVGARFDKWYRDKLKTVSFNFDSDVITSDITLYAGWLDAPLYTVRAYAADSNGTITPKGTFTLKEGADQIFVLKPNAGYEVESLKLDGKDVGFANNRYELKGISQNHIVSVSFRLIPEIKHTISASSADTFGMISPSGDVEIKDGEDRTFYFDALEGYKLDYIEVDGFQIQLSGNSYTFKNVTKGHTIVAHFKEKKIEPIIPPGYHVVKFVANGETVSSIMLIDGSTVNRPEDPEVKGQIFQGWFDGNNKWDFSNPITKDLTLTAKFLSETVSEGDIHSGMDDKMNISDPDDITMVVGQTYRFGEGIWTSTDASVVSIGRKNGVAKAKSPSNVLVTITDSSRLPGISYKIRVLAPEMSEKNVTMGVGSTQKISLLYSDGLNIAWTSSNPRIASVEEGLIKTKSKGNAKIYAWANGRKYPCSVKVVDTFTAPSNFDGITAFTLRPTQSLNLRNVSIAGQKPNKLDWRLSDESGTRVVNKSGWLAWDDGVCRVDINGKLQAKACGNSTIIGRQGDVRVKTIRVNVATIPSKTETYINVGKNEKLSYYKVVNNKASWSATRQGEIVKLGNTNSTRGRVYGLAVGTSVVSCSYNGMYYQTTVHVENPSLNLEDDRIGRLKENLYVLNLKSGKRFMLDMPGVTQQVIWTSSNKSIAFVDEFGMVEGRMSGNTVVSTKINGTSVKVKVYVTE